MKWKGIASTAASAVLACGLSAFASDVQQSAAQQNIGTGTNSNPVLLDDTTTAPAAAPAAAAPSQTTLTPTMYLLDPTPVGQFLEKYHLSFTGFIETGYFVDTNNIKIGGNNANNVPNTLIAYPGAYSNKFDLDQLDFTFSKSIDSTKAFDWGALFETGYGSDDAYFHSHGLLDNRAPGRPQNQYDILQANVSLLVPLGSGLTLTGGKFVGILGEEVINPTGNLFFTHSYSFDYGVAATDTGTYGSYTFSKLVNGNDWTFEAGGTNGWNQSLRDNNGAIDFVASASGQLTSKLHLITNIQEGPEAAHDNGDFWTDLEVIPSLTVSDQLTVSADCVYGDAPHGAAGSGFVAGADSAQWYGSAFYANYKLNGMFAFNARAEWFREQGVSQFGTGNPFSANYYELTLGTQIHPLPDSNIFQYLQFRPEIRVDDSDRRAFALERPNGEYSQLTFAVDAIMQF